MAQQVSATWHVPANMDPVFYVLSDQKSAWSPLLSPASLSSSDHGRLRLRLRFRPRRLLVVSQLHHSAPLVYIWFGLCLFLFPGLAPLSLFLSLLHTPHADSSERCRAGSSGTCRHRALARPAPPPHASRPLGPSAGHLPTQLSPPLLLPSLCSWLLTDLFCGLAKQPKHGRGAPAWPRALVGGPAPRWEGRMGGSRPPAGRIPRLSGTADACTGAAFSAAPTPTH